MKESAFYKILDRAQELSDKDITRGYYPTIEEIETHNIMDNLELYLPLIAYFATDPFTKQQIAGFDTKEYKAAVKYCKDVLTKIPFD